MPPLSGDIDLCEFVEANKIPQITNAVKALGINPAKCPIQEVSTEHLQKFY